uniref:NADH dehydrogenase subunit 4L n=1 Tax=Spinibdella lignicola TaxID=2872682 RepID=A0A977X351_9ACAR|nr:NADH dehydrogenase subunit 4L [Spinibdella lignicola]UXN44122.1 NADH dehydrogenase subunit 4L [Spinibdella lignicola]
MIIFLMGLMIMFGGFMNYLIVLLSFEMMFYGCLYYYLYSGGLEFDLIGFVILIVMVVCGSCYGLCLLVVLGRSLGSDMSMF